MTLLPIVARELRVAARKPATYWSRLSLGLALTIFFSFTLWVSEGQSRPSSIGQGMFQLATWLSFMFCVLAGARVTADCISSEKREGTLGLLFLTDLRGYDVILGKLLSSSVTTLSALASSLPVLGIPILMGGVTLLAFVKVAATLVATLILSLAVGILCSTLGKSDRRTGGSTLLIMLALTGGLPLTYAILNESYDLSKLPWIQYLRWPSPGYACFLASQEVFTRVSPRVFRIDEWLQSLACLLGMSLACIALASALIGHLWQEKAAGKSNRPWRHWFDGIFYGWPARRRRLRRYWLEINPVTWLTLRSQLKHFGAWLLVAALAGIWLLVRIRMGREAYESEVAVWLLMSLQISMKMLMAGEAGLVFARDIRSGALELMLTSSLTVSEILGGQLRALRHIFLKPAIVVLIGDALLMVGALIAARPNLAENGVEIVLGFLAVMIVFVADLYTLAWVGMWTGISAKNASTATSEAVGKVLMLPWIVLYVLMAVMAWVTYFFQLNFDPGFLVFLGIWFIGSLINDFIWLRYAYDHLHREFRVRALQRYTGERPHDFWATLGQRLRRIWD